MWFFGSDFNWTSGFDTFQFSSATRDCSSGVGYRSTIPPANDFNSDGLIPRALVSDASIVANITKVTDFRGNITIASCKVAGVPMLPDDAKAWKPVVGPLTVIKGQCIAIMIDVEPANCSTNSLEVESALIGDFCARSPTAEVCKDHDPKVTVPPAVRATLGADTPSVTSNSTGSANSTTTAPSNGSSSTNTPGVEAKSGGATTNRQLIPRTELASLVAYVSVAMAST